MLRFSTKLVRQKEMIHKIHHNKPVSNHISKPKLNLESHKRSIFGLPNFLKEDKAPQLDPELVKLLVCPISKKPLRYDPEMEELIQDEEGIVYEVKNGIPILLASEAKSLHEFINQEDKKL